MSIHQLVHMRVGHVLKSEVEAIGRLPMRLYSSTVDTEHHALLAPNPQQTGRCRGVASYVKEWSNKIPAMVAMQKHEEQDEKVLMQHAY